MASEPAEKLAHACSTVDACSTVEERSIVDACSAVEERPFRAAKGVPNQ